MLFTKRDALLATMATALLFSSITKAQALHSATSYIMEGKLAPKVDWAVQVVSQGKGSCTGAAINQNYILTARHCANADKITINYSADKNNIVGNENVEVDVKNIKMPNNEHYDIALLPLVKPHPLKNYAQLNQQYSVLGKPGKAPRPPEEGTIYGYGSHNAISNLPPKELYEAQVSILWQQDLAYGIVGIIVKGITGSCSQGDSGGPLMVKNKIVGVLHGQSELNPSKYGQCSYTALNTTDHVVNDWLSSVLKH